MKTPYLALALSAAALLTAAQEGFCQTTEKSPIDRYALYVASNNGGPGREVLRYAGSDAEKVAQTLSEIGGVPAAKSILLIDPARSDVDLAFESIAADIARNKGKARRSEFIFYYSGHSDEAALLLGTETYGYGELKASLGTVPSDVHVVMLDSCYSGNFVRTKGGSRQKPFLMDDSTIVQGHAYLSSSSEYEASQESDKIQASYFTHALVSGLRGAADSSGDRRVSLNELYHYAFNETLAKTESSTIGPQHPSYNITLVGSGDLVMTDISDAESMIHIPADQEGAYFFRNSGGILVSEINKMKGTEVALALPSGYYQVSLVTPLAASQGSIRLERGQKISLDPSRFSSVIRSQGRARGMTVQPLSGEEEEYDPYGEFDPNNEADLAAVREYARARAEEADHASRQEQAENQAGAGLPGPGTRWEPISVSLFPGLEFPQNPGDYVNVAVSPFMLANRHINGVQAAGFMAMNDGSLQGVQAAGFMATATGVINGVQAAGFMCTADSDQTMNGMQASGFLNSVEGSLHGPQFAGFLNSISGDLKGFQAAGFMNSGEGFIDGGQAAGFLNSADKGFNGLQAAGFLNSAGEVSRGVQVSGFINVANEIEGAQIGIVNIAKKNQGVALGLLNFIADGIMAASVYGDTNGMGWAQYQGGTKQFFTTFCLGTPVRWDRQWDWDFTVFGFGVGHRLFEFGNMSVDVEIFSKQVIDPKEWESYGELVIETNEEAKNFSWELAQMQIPSARITGNMHIADHLSCFASWNADVLIPGYNDKAFTYGKTGTLQEMNDNLAVYTSWSFGVRF